MKQKFEVELETTDDGGQAFEVAADARDIRAWESTYGESYVATPTSATQLAQVAHLAAKRLGLFEGTWEAFNRQAVTVRGVRAQDPPRAARTQKGRTAGSSSDSPSDSGSSHPNSKKKAKKS